MDFINEYNFAKQHKDNHKSCGGEPYKSASDLFRVVNNFYRSQNEKINILEIGTAVGFTTFVLDKACDCNCEIVTIEHHEVHIEEAKKNLTDWGVNISNISFLVGESENILPTLTKSTFDIIFFDGYGVKSHHFEFFEKQLRHDRLLIVANKHLKSTEQEFFQKIEESGKFLLLESFADTEVYKKIK